MYPEPVSKNYAEGFCTLVLFINVVLTLEWYCVLVYQPNQVKGVYISVRLCVVV